ncbi:hypothetical protein C8R44DRAFT_746146 [Mycena epipterygia]|nr:hypothetical protein C8R44DRAFT_746146 [Mycena epipterygia]
MSESESFNRRRRVYIACLNCRKRKIKCLNEESLQRPCERCIRKGLICEYIPVANEQAQSAGSNPPPPTQFGFGHRPPAPYSPPPAVHPAPAFNPTPAYGGYNGPSNVVQPQQHIPSMAPVLGHHRNPRVHPISAPYQVPPYAYRPGPAPASSYGTGQHVVYPATAPPQQSGSSAYPNNYGNYPYEWTSTRSSHQSHSIKYSESASALRDLVIADVGDVQRRRKRQKRRKNESVPELP